MPAKGRTPNTPPRRPRVAGLNRPPRPTTPDQPQPDAAPGQPRQDAPADQPRQAPADQPRQGLPAPPPVDADTDTDTVTEQWAATPAPTTDAAPAASATSDRGLGEGHLHPNVLDKGPLHSEPPAPSPASERAEGTERVKHVDGGDADGARADDMTSADEMDTGRRLSGVLLVAVLLLVTVAAGASAVFFRGQAARASTGSADNLVLVDTAATGEVVGQVSKAIETVLSYDYTKLDENEAAGRAVITGKYGDEFGTTFADVRKTAPEQKLVLTTTVLLAGVTTLSADRAEVIATMDLAAVRDTTPYNSPGRVKVVATRVDGRWKITEMTLL